VEFFALEVVALAEFELDLELELVLGSDPLQPVARTHTRTTADNCATGILAIFGFHSVRPGPVQRLNNRLSASQVILSAARPFGRTPNEVVAHITSHGGDHRLLTGIR
jgi:hypothetical protein